MAITLEQRIGELRREYGTVKAAAKALGLTDSALNHLQHGNRQGSPETLRKLGLRRVVTYERIGG